MTAKNVFIVKEGKMLRMNESRKIAFKSILNDRIVAT